MGMYQIDELMLKWRRGELTVEQAIGQILLWLQHIEKRGRGPEPDIYDTVYCEDGSTVLLALQDISARK